MLLELHLEPGKKLTLTVDIDPHATVSELKQKINALNQSKDPNNLHCIFKAAGNKYPDILEDSKTLTEYGILEGNSIQYLYQKASTSESSSSSENKE
jgi:hypothetical protein